MRARAFAAAVAGLVASCSPEPYEVRGTPLDAVAPIAAESRATTTLAPPASSAAKERSDPVPTSGVTHIHPAGETRTDGGLR
jgi:hypothetical protein